MRHRVGASTVVEPDPNLGNVSTTYTYNLLNKLIQVSMPRGSTTQNRYFNYDQSNQGAMLMSAIRQYRRPQPGDDLHL